jgi:multiple sugar transport system substrate-binding protein
MGDNFVDTSIKSYNQDTDADWRPRTAKWPAIGGEMATAIQSALVGEKSSSQALIDAQAKIDKLMMG